MVDPDKLSFLVQRAAAGEPGGAAALAQAVQLELRELAAALLRHERPGHSLQATALANEAWMRLEKRFGADTPWENRRAFFGAAAQAMRRLLVDHARERASLKRGGGRARLELDVVVQGLQGEPLDAALVLDLNTALDELAQLDERAARVVELHIFAGLSQPEVAEALGVSVGTVELDWRSARAWLRRRLDGSSSGGD
jgi:RNA polymerase sigma factor (TIGR02999 family)